jgi:hypothetical protein
MFSPWGVRSAEIRWTCGRLRRRRSREYLSAGIAKVLLADGANGKSEDGAPRGLGSTDIEAAVIPRSCARIDKPTPIRSFVVMKG